MEGIVSAQLLGEGIGYDRWNQNLSFAEMVPSELSQKKQQVNNYGANQLSRRLIKGRIAIERSLYYGEKGKGTGGAYPSIPLAKSFYSKNGS